MSTRSFTSHFSKSGIFHRGGVRNVINNTRTCNNTQFINPLVPILPSITSTLPHVRG